MNIFLFTLSDSQEAVTLAFSYGVVFGFILGLFRYLLISVFDRQTP